jgi:O-methyltransferase
MHDAIPDAGLYQPLFSPWLGLGEFPRFLRRTEGNTLVSADRCYILYSLARQALNIEGEFWECGVYKGGTAALLAQVLADLPATLRRNLRLFDTFQGMPEVDSARDLHSAGDFADTSVQAVKAVVDHDHQVFYHQGFIPETFAGLEPARIAFAHVDVDIYKSVQDCCKFIFPRLSRGGFIVFDDYGFRTCPGARAAVDEYFQGTGFIPLVLPTGQAVIFKNA